MDHPTRHLTRNVQQKCRKAAGLWLDLEKKTTIAKYQCNEAQGAIIQLLKWLLSKQEHLFQISLFPNIFYLLMYKVEGKKLRTFWSKIVWWQRTQHKLCSLGGITGLNNNCYGETPMNTILLNDTHSRAFLHKEIIFKLDYPSSVWFLIEPVQCRRH